MKCPKCGYVSHDYLDACHRCRTDWVEFKKEIHLEVLEPGELDVSLAAGDRDDVARFGTSGEFSVDDPFFASESLLVDREEDVGDDFDIELTDEDSPDTSTEDPGDATQEAVATPGVTELEADPDFVMLSEDEGERIIDLGAIEAGESGDAASVFTESDTEDTLHPSVDMIDMSDLEDLDEDFEAVDIEEVSEAEVIPEEAEDMAVTPALEAEEQAPRDTSSDMDLAPTLMIEDLSELELSEADSADAADIPILDETVQLTLSELQHAPPAPETPEAVPALASDDRLEAEPELEMEASETESSESEDRPAPPKPEVVLDVEELELEEDDENDC